MRTVEENHHVQMSVCFKMMILNSLEGTYYYYDTYHIIMRQFLINVRKLGEYTPL